MEFFNGCSGIQTKIDGHTVVQVTGTCLFCCRSHSVYIKYPIYFEIKFGQKKQAFQQLPEEIREFLCSGRCMSCLATEKQKLLINDSHIAESTKSSRHEVYDWESVEEEQKSEAVKFQEITEQKPASLRFNKLRSLKHIKNEHEEREFFQLVAEISQLRFATSSQVSAYIRNNNLGLKYKHISGILQMEKDGREWKFDGGFPPWIYARLCNELGLSNQGSRAKPTAFTPYKDIIDH